VNAYEVMITPAIPDSLRIWTDVTEPLALSRSGSIGMSTSTSGAFEVNFAMGLTRHYFGGFVESCPDGDKVGDCSGRVLTLLLFIQAQAWAQSARSLILSPLVHDVRFRGLVA
jgi:hypothetical protein